MRSIFLTLGIFGLMCGYVQAGDCTHYREEAIRHWEQVEVNAKRARYYGARLKKIGDANDKVMGLNMLHKANQHKSQMNKSKAIFIQCMNAKFAEHRRR